MHANQPADPAARVEERLRELMLAALAADALHREERRADVLSLSSSIEEQMCSAGLDRGAARTQAGRLLDGAVEEAVKLLTDISKIAGHYTR